MIIELSIILAIFFQISPKIKSGKLLAAFFFLSNAMAFYLHTIGYLDHIFMLLVLVVLLLPMSRWSIPLLFFVTALGPFIHELFFVIAAPILATRAILEGKYFGWALLPLLGITLFLFFGPYATCTNGARFAMMESIRMQSHFIIRDDVFDVLKRNGISVMQVMNYERWFALSALTSFLIFLLIMHRQNASLTLKPWLWQGVFVLLIWATFALPPHLMDLYQIPEFPFTAHREFLVNVMQGKIPFPPIPQH